MNTSIGRKIWAIPEGYIPEWSHGPGPELTSHEAFCVLNANDTEAQIKLTVYYTDREPGGPYRLKVGPRRTSHFRFNTLTDPEPIPRGVGYASVFESTVRIVIQHTRLDSRQAANALMTTIAFPGAD